MQTEGKKLQLLEVKQLGQELFLHYSLKNRASDR